MSSWVPVVVLMKTHWTGRKLPFPSHWGGVWGVALWMRRLDLTSQLPGPTRQRSSGVAGPWMRPVLSLLLLLISLCYLIPAFHAVIIWCCSRGSTHSAMVSHSVLYHIAPSHSGQHTSTAPCCGHTEPLQRVLKVNTSEETAADRETHLYIHHQVYNKTLHSYCRDGNANGGGGIGECCV